MYVTLACIHTHFFACFSSTFNHIVGCEHSSRFVLHSAAFCVGASNMNFLIMHNYIITAHLNSICIAFAKQSITRTFACILHLHASWYSSVACIVEQVTVHPPSSQHCASWQHSHRISTGGIYVHAAKEHQNKIRPHFSISIRRGANLTRCIKNVVNMHQNAQQMCVAVSWCVYMWAHHDA